MRAVEAKIAPILQGKNCHDSYERIPRVGDVQEERVHLALEVLPRLGLETGQAHVALRQRDAVLGDPQCLVEIFLCGGSPHFVELKGEKMARGETPAD